MRERGHGTELRWRALYWGNRKRGKRSGETERIRVAEEEERQREGWEAGRVLLKGNIVYGWAQVLLRVATAIPHKVRPVQMPQH